MGTLKIVSSDPDKALSFKVDALKSVFPLKTGRHLLRRRRSAKPWRITQRFTASTASSTSCRRRKPILMKRQRRIDVTMKFDEGKQYYVRRIEFTGNTTTRDKVIRRELLIDEGQLFNKHAVGNQYPAAEPVELFRQDRSG